MTPEPLSAVLDVHELTRRHQRAADAIEAFLGLPWSELGARLLMDHVLRILDGRS